MESTLVYSQLVTCFTRDLRPLFKNSTVQKVSQETVRDRRTQTGFNKLLAEDKNRSDPINYFERNLVEIGFSKLPWGQTEDD